MCIKPEYPEGELIRYKTGWNMSNAWNFGQSEADMYEYKAKVAERNTELARMQAKSTAEAGSYKAGKILEQGAQVAGAQGVALSSAGLDIGAGSPLALLMQTSKQAADDKSNLMYSTAMDVWGLQNQMADYQHQAETSRVAASNSRKAGMFNTANALLTGQSDLAKLRYDNKQYQSKAPSFDLGSPFKKTSKYKLKEYAGYNVNDYYIG